VTNRDPLIFQSLVDLLDRKNAEALARLREAHPAHANKLRRGKQLGSLATEHNIPFLRDLANATLQEVQLNGQDISLRLNSKARWSARFRFFASIVTAFCSGTLVIAVIEGSKTTAVINGGIAFCGAVLTLIAQYIDDFSGGLHSIKEMRTTVITKLAEVNALKADLRMMVATNQFDELEGLIRKLNVSAATLREIELSIA
jgi:hypothetical protein